MVDVTIDEGTFAGGTGMICHEFKGGTGTSSRVVLENGMTYTVGALVQANYGSRELLRIAGVPVGRDIGPEVVPAHFSGKSPNSQNEQGSSIIPLLAPHAP